jgi:hypothetical protein
VNDKTKFTPDELALIGDYETMYAKGEYHKLCADFCHESYHVDYDNSGNLSLELCSGGVSLELEKLPPEWRDARKLDGSRHPEKHTRRCGAPKDWPPAAMDALKRLADHIILELVRKQGWLGC